MIFFKFATPKPHLLKWDFMISKPEICDCGSQQPFYPHCDTIVSSIRVFPIPPFKLKITSIDGAYTLKNVAKFHR